MSKSELIGEVVAFSFTHMKAVEQWEHGDIKTYWICEDNTVCVRYEDGQEYHYKRLDDGYIEYW